MKRKIRSASLFHIKPTTKFPASKNKKYTTAEEEGIFPETLVILLLLNISKFLRSTYGKQSFFSMCTLENERHTMLLCPAQNGYKS